MAKDVFISYSSAELKEAEFVKNILEKNDISCWMAPASIPGGSNYAREIPCAIAECRIFVLILSTKAQESKWVPAEIETAVNMGKTIFPFVIEPCELNPEFNFMLSRSQRILAYNDLNGALDRLISIIKDMFGNNSRNEIRVNSVQGFKNRADIQQVEDDSKKASKFITVVLMVAIVVVFVVLLILIYHLLKKNEIISLGSSIGWQTASKSLGDFIDMFRTV